MNILISSISDDPIYQQIFRQIQQAIFDGDINEGDPLPSIRKLAREIKVSVITTKRAYEELEKENLITTVPGKGTFVAAIKLDSILERKRFLLEEQLETLIGGAKQLNIGKEEFVEMVSLIYED